MTTTPRLVRPFTQVNTTDNGALQYSGQIVGLNSSDGGYVIIWTDASHTFSSGDAVIGQRFDAAGNKVGGEVKISRFVNGDDSNGDGSSITLLPNGNIAVTYTDLFSGALDTYVRIVNPSLALVRDDNIDVSGLRTTNPSITSFADGSYVVSYTAYFGGLDSDIRAQIVSSDGNVGAPIPVKDNGTLDADFSQLATLSNNNFVDAWQQQTGNPGLYFSIYTSAGATSTLTGRATFYGATTADQFTSGRWMVWGPKRKAVSRMLQSPTTGTSKAPATSMATGRATFYGATTAGRFTSGR
jgi:hypothetical protein